MYTSLGIVALAGFLVAPSPLPGPDLVWWRDYQVAQQKGAKEHKPLAIIVGAGPGGFDQLTKEGELNATIRAALRVNYVCVYLDTQSPTQSALIKAFEVTKGTGLILSDRAGTLQAFHHDGPIASGELVSQLQRFAGSDVEVSTTVSNTVPRFSYYPADSSSNRQPAYAPAFSTRNC